MPETPRILVVEGGSQQLTLRMREHTGWDVVQANDAATGLSRLQQEHFDGILIDTRDPAIWSQAEVMMQAQRILDAIVDAVAVVSPDLRIRWANQTFEDWCGGPTVGMGFYDALGSPGLLGPAYSPFQTALTGVLSTTRLACKNNRLIELHVTPVYGPDKQITQLISLGRDITAVVQQQQKLDALHKACNELAALAPDQLAEMTVAERIELLKLNIRKLTHDLLRYDVIEIRLLNSQSKHLEILLTEGMTTNAEDRVLSSCAEGNGITGYVAATGKSYNCPDTARDPLYIEGAAGARSSLTVPLTVQDEVIGTFNIESPKLNAFGEEEVKFAEMFGREIAAGLHTLQLLTVEKQATANESIAKISNEVALPVDEILAAATSILDRYIGHEPEMAEKLRQIISSARALKQSIQKVGEDLAGCQAPILAAEAAPHLLKGKRVLVADSDERLRKSAHSLLGKLGCIVETARDGQEALTLARMSSYDAILADIRLPDISGYEAYRRLRQAQPKANIVLMTAYGYDPSHSIVKARQDGLKHVLFKPIRDDQLIEALGGPPCEKAP